MKFIVTILAASVALANAAAMQCSQVSALVVGNEAVATPFCKVYLQVAPTTIFETATTTRATVTVSMPTYTTTVTSVTPDAISKEFTETNTESVTVTPGTTTVTSTITSTAYLDPTSSTIAIMKRDEATHSAGELAARAMATPAWLKDMSRLEIRDACGCLNIPTQTIIVSRTAAATATETKVLERKIIKTTTIDAVTALSTSTVTRSITVTAAAPRETDVAVEIAQVNGCPPDQPTTWVCPDQTGTDTGVDPNYQTCAVTAQDSYIGYCLYWSDDGSPAYSSLTLGDGTGNTANDKTREAVYGDATTDDCPSWANWTCDASGGTGTKRSTIEIASDEHEFSKRGFVPKKMSVAQHKRLGKSKMPKGLKRGGKYQPSRTTRTKSSKSGKKGGK